MVLITGAGGFLGTHLTGALVKRKEPVRCLARKPADRAKLERFGAETVLGDVLDRKSLERAMAGVWAVCHLVHGIEGDDRRKGITLEMIDQLGAANVLDACRANGTRRVLYVSILGASPAARSRLLASRWRTEELIRGSGLDFTILRTGFVIGRGSRGFEGHLSLVQKCPVVPLPGNGKVLHQPIALSDLLSYLIGCLDDPRTCGKTFDAGGPDRLSYVALVGQVAQALGRRRLTVNLPWGVVRPLLSLGSALGLRRAGVLHEMIASMQVDMVCGDMEIGALMPGPSKGFRESLAEYLAADPSRGEPHENREDYRHRVLPSRGAHS
ncbi:MAG: NAD(P)H-binding protein [Candidatus Rokubacteria bacterium]|nr:NAD(P)H-binding protein [Candidatus Rokubacteria bacterium]